MTILSKLSLCLGVAFDLFTVFNFYLKPFHRVIISPLLFFGKFFILKIFLNKNKYSISLIYLKRTSLYYFNSIIQFSCLFSQNTFWVFIFFCRSFHFFVNVYLWQILNIVENIIIEWWVLNYVELLADITKIYWWWFYFILGLVSIL